eukprot:1070-Heterococcus_DN1.PRE.3
MEYAVCQYTLFNIYQHNLQAQFSGEFLILGFCAGVAERPHIGSASNLKPHITSIFQHLHQVSSCEGLHLAKDAKHAKCKRIFASLVADCSRIDCSRVPSAFPLLISTMLAAHPDPLKNSSLKCIVICRLFDKETGNMSSGTGVESQNPTESTGVKHMWGGSGVQPHNAAKGAGGPQTHFHSGPNTDPSDQQGFINQAHSALSGMTSTGSERAPTSIIDSSGSSSISGGIGSSSSTDNAGQYSAPGVKLQDASAGELKEGLKAA